MKQEHDVYTIDMWGGASQLERVKPSPTAGHKSIILRALREHGALGKDAIAARTPLDRAAVCRRLVELRREGLVRLTGRVVTSTSGKYEREWEVA